MKACRNETTQCMKGDEPREMVEEAGVRHKGPVLGI